MTKIKLSLLENAFSFLNHSLSHAIIAEKEKNHWKFAILNLVQAVELILKELLRKEHPRLIYKNIDDPKETVSLNFAVTRLQKIARIKFKDEDLNTISAASKYRNNIVHYEFSFPLQEIKLLYAQLLGFLQSFVQEYFSKTLNEIVFDEEWEEAVKILEYSSELKIRAEERMRREKIDEQYVIKCKQCNQITFVIQDSKNICYLCGYRGFVEKCSLCNNYFFEEDLTYDHRHSDEPLCNQCFKNIDFLDIDFFDYD